MKSDDESNAIQFPDGEGGYAQNCTLRDYFAGQVIVFCLEKWAAAAGEDKSIESAEFAVDSSYRIADAMIRRRMR